MCFVVSQNARELPSSLQVSVSNAVEFRLQSDEIPHRIPETTAGRLIGLQILDPILNRCFIGRKRPTKKHPLSVDSHRCNHLSKSVNENAS
ncbi:hypothetical protein PCANC_15197 [Puccinia coronata f. sp. avenae]|uniref:Uncharacterized protein n=1 Tax=Puccinia coronata f. sp. avenae TaxID=200324 RepID=A0A2N5UFC6_9BASI|nr:hypothetical protein PCANC_15197 [Puccinia coronata f. sp. avenae]